MDYLLLGYTLLSSPGLFGLARETSSRRGPTAWTSFRSASLRLTGRVGLKKQLVFRSSRCWRWWIKTASRVYRYIIRHQRQLKRLQTIFFGPSSSWASEEGSPVSLRHSSPGKTSSCQSPDKTPCQGEGPSVWVVVGGLLKVGGSF